MAEAVLHVTDSSDAYLEALARAAASDDLSNLTSLCATHHLQGVHKGRIRVTGCAPDRLVWEVVRKSKQ